jgi:hypothetical protein
MVAVDFTVGLLDSLSADLVDFTRADFTLADFTAGDSIAMAPVAASAWSWFPLLVARGGAPSWVGLITHIVTKLLRLRTLTPSTGTAVIL